MSDFKSVIEIIISFLPITTAIICLMLIAFSYKNSISRIELNVKSILIVFYIFAILTMSGAITFTKFPAAFVYINLFPSLSILTAPVLFYHLIYILTPIDNRKFPWVHYILPVSVTLLIFIWSLFVPFEVKLGITTNHENPINPDYRIFSILYTSKPMGRAVFGLVYALCFSCIRLVRYYRMKKTELDVAFKPMRWVILLMALSSSVWLISILAMFMTRDSYLSSIWTLSTIVLVVCQYVLMTNQALRRRFTIFVPEEENLQKPETKQIEVVKNVKKEKGHINKREFEAMWRKEKPYLNPEFTMASLVELLKVNRTYLSEFINRTYGMNFNTFMNRYRLREFERLKALRSNAGKPKSVLAGKAGFASYRTYLRAVEAANEADDRSETFNQKGE